MSSVVEIDLEQSWKDIPLIAFDTETSGGYPVGCEVVEFGAVKWLNGQEIDTLQVLIKPRQPMSDFIITIHGITNEMVADAPPMSAVAQQIRDFFRGGVSLAHHAPFDLGFLSFEFEKNHITLPSEPALCSSLLSRKLIHGVPNHKLQTLVKHFGFDGGSAHRALDDARSCLKVALECFKLLDEGKQTIKELIKLQGSQLWWKDFSLLNKADQKVQTIIEAIFKEKKLEIIYQKGNYKGERRLVNPVGIVKSLDGDYLMAFCEIDKANKRFFLKNISEAEVVF